MTGPSQELGISDDDLCASCANLDYHPGDLSLCKLVNGHNSEWQARFDEDGYAVFCRMFIPVPTQGWNIKEASSDYIHP